MIFLHLLLLSIMEVFVQVLLVMVFVAFIFFLNNKPASKPGRGSSSSSSSRGTFSPSAPPVTSSMFKKFGINLPPSYVG